jgi:hypothetical protein
MRIRHYGLIANAGRRDNLARARELLAVPLEADARENKEEQPATDTPSGEPRQPAYVCPNFGAPMIIIETLVRVQPICAPPQLRGAA